jgi:hypothetical protein
MIVHPPLHAAYVYDMLSILEVKWATVPSDTNRANMDDLMAYLAGVVGLVTHSAILFSDEYRDLTKANILVFQRIDAIKQRAPTGEDATYIDQHNHMRWLAKLALQRRFFPDCPFTEQKIGYDTQWQANHGSTAP